MPFESRQPRPHRLDSEVARPPSAQPANQRLASARLGDMLEQRLVGLEQPMHSMRIEELRRPLIAFGRLDRMHMRNSAAAYGTRHERPSSCPSSQSATSALDHNPETSSYPSGGRQRDGRPYQ